MKVEEHIGAFQKLFSKFNIQKTSYEHYFVVAHYHKSNQSFQSKFCGAKSPYLENDSKIIVKSFVNSNPGKVYLFFHSQLKIREHAFTTLHFLHNLQMGQIS